MIKSTRLLFQEAVDYSWEIHSTLTCLLCAVVLANNLFPSYPADLEPLQSPGARAGLPRSMDLCPLYAASMLEMICSK